MSAPLTSTAAAPAPLTPESKFLLRFLSRANRTSDVGEIAAASLDIIRALIPFDLAFFVLLDLEPPALKLGPSDVMPDELAASLRALHLPVEFFAKVNDPVTGAYQLPVLANAIKTVLAEHGYSNPITIPLTTEYRGLGVLTLVRQGGDVTQLIQAQLAHKDFLDAIGAQVGSALERARLVEQLRESEERHRTFIMDSPDAFWESDANGYVTLVNQAALDMAGFARDEVLGKVFASRVITSPEERAERKERLERDGKIAIERLQFRTKSGAIKTIAVTTRAVRDANGKMIKQQTIFRDITAHARADEELRVRGQIAELLSSPPLQPRGGTRDVPDLRLDVQAHLERVCELVASLTDMDAVGIFLLDRERRVICLSAHKNFDPVLTQAYGRFELAPDLFGGAYTTANAPGILEYIMLAPHPLCDQDIRAQPLQDLRQQCDLSLAVQAGFRSGIGVSIRHSDNVYGVIVVGSRTSRALTEHDADLLRDIGSRLGLALHNQYLLEDTARRVRELERLAMLSEVSSSLVHTPTLIDLALEVMMDLFEVPIASVHLIQVEDKDPARNEHLVTHIRSPILPPLQPRGGTRDVPDLRLDKTLPLTSTLRRILDSRKPLVLDAQHPALTGSLTELDPVLEARAAHLGVKAVIIAPLVTPRDRLGLLSVAHRQEHLWSDVEIHSIAMIANHLATALANTRMFEAQLERARKLTLLMELSRACSLTLNLQALLETAVAQVKDMLDASQVSIRLVENQRSPWDGELTEGLGIGYTDPTLPLQDLRRAQRFKIDPWFQRLLDSQQPLAIADIETFSEFPPDWKERKRREGSRAFLMVPLSARSQALGCLNIFRSQPHLWSEAEITFAQTIANTVAVALANARLFESLQQERRDVEATLNSVFSGVFTTDLNGVIQTINRAGVEMTGYARERLVGRNWATEVASVGTEHKPDELIFEAIADRGVVFGLAPRSLKTADGREIPLSEAAAPLLDAEGKILGVVGSFWDRTKERQAHDTKLKFLLEVSHELRNSLTGVLAMADLLRQKKLPPVTRERAIGVITDHAERLRNFSKRFLEFESEEFKEPVDEQELDLDGLIKRLAERCRLEHPEHTVTVKGRGASVYADPARLETVLVNLLDNAAKFSPAATPITIQVNRLEEQPLQPRGGTLALAYAQARARDVPDLRIGVAIRNFGPVIPAEQMAHLFERGAHAPVEVEGQVVNGTGLGLWLVQTKLREMGGEIWADSRPNHGTTFYFTLRQVSNRQIVT